MILTTKPFLEKQQPPMVSITCITYNHERFISEAIESFLMQDTTFPVEIIIGEDCSTDDTREIVKQYCRRYPEFIRMVTADVNVGARLNGIRTRQLATGKYIALCEGDDYWTDPLKLQKQVDFLETHPGYVMSFHDCCVIDENGNLLKASKLERNCNRDLSEKDIIFGTLMPTNTVVFRNGIITQYPEEFLTVLNGDAFLFAMLAEHGKAHYAADVKPATYRVHSGGVWSLRTNTLKMANRIFTYQQLLRVISEKHKDVVKERLFLSTMQFSVLQQGAIRKIRHYLSAYRYFSLSRRSLGSFFRGNAYLIFSLGKQLMRKAQG